MLSGQPDGDKSSVKVFSPQLKTMISSHTSQPRKEMSETLSQGKPPSSVVPLGYLSPRPASTLKSSENLNCSYVSPFHSARVSTLIGISSSGLSAVLSSSLCCEFPLRQVFSRWPKRQTYPFDHSRKGRDPVWVLVRI